MGSIFAPDTAFRVFRHSPSHDIKLKSDPSKRELEQPVRILAAAGHRARPLWKTHCFDNENKSFKENIDSHGTPNNEYTQGIHGIQTKKNLSDLETFRFVQAYSISSTHNLIVREYLTKIYLQRAAISVKIKYSQILLAPAEWESERHDAVKMGLKVLYIFRAELTKK